MIPITRRASHSTRCTPFLYAHALVEDLPHTDPADLTDFVVGGESHRGWWSAWLYGFSDSQSAPSAPSTPSTPSALFSLFTKAK